LNHQTCLKSYEASANSEDLCLPLTKPADCSQSAYDALQSFAFKAHLTPAATARKGKRKGIINFEACFKKLKLFFFIELVIQGLDQCLKTQSTSDGLEEKCIPSIKPDECTGTYLK